MPRPTIYDVARAAGVSKSLVSLVLQGSDRVSEKSRAEVERAIRELGYRPSRAASDLAAGRTKLVGVLIDDYANPWFVDLLRGLHHVLGGDGFRVSVIDTATTSIAEDPIDGLLSMRADGIVVARDVPDALISAASPPVVIAGTRDNAPTGVDAVANDDALGARLAAEHLVGLGHRVVGHLAAAGGAAAARRRSFVDAVAEAGARVIPTDYSGPATEHAGFDGAARLLADHPDVTGIFAANDVMAIGALGAARDLGLDVPGRLSIIGYDNTSLARTRLINLTTVDDNGFGVGREAGRILRDRMSGIDAQPVALTLPPALVTRGTTAPAP